jgi:hypothetical protein
MANYRQIHTQIWRDNWFLDLEPDEKLLFIYLFSNDNSNLAGIYEIHERIVAMETGLERTRIREILTKLEASNKVHYQDGVVWIVNMRKYHSNASEKVQKNIDDAIYDIQDGEIKKRYCIANGITLENTVCIPYGYSMDTVSHSKSNNNNKSNSKSKTEEEDKAKAEAEKEDAAELPELPTYSDNPTYSTFIRIYKNEIGKLTKKDEEVIGGLVGVFKEKDFENAVLHMKAATKMPNAGYLRTILDNQFRERKIQKVYTA